MRFQMVFNADAHEPVETHGHPSIPATGWWRRKDHADRSVS
jgi:hypothetical protein